MTEKYYQTNEVTTQLTQEFGEEVKPGRLFFYEEQGLLKVKRDENNGYRLYVEEDLQDLRLILSFVSAGVDLLLIKGFLQNTLTTSEFIEITNKVTNTDKAIPVAKEALGKYRFTKV